MQLHPPSASGAPDRAGLIQSWELSVTGRRCAAGTVAPVESPPDSAEFSGLRGWVSAPASLSLVGRQLDCEVPRSELVESRG